MHAYVLAPIFQITLLFSMPFIAFPQNQTASNPSLVFHFNVSEMMGQWWVVYGDGTNVEYHFNKEKENSTTHMKTNIKVVFCEGKNEC